MLDSPVINWLARVPKPEQYFSSPMYPALVSVITKIKAHRLRYLENLTILYSARFFRFPQKNLSFPVSAAVDGPVFTATVAAFCPLVYTG